MIIESGVQIGPNINIGNFFVLPLNTYTLYTNLTTETDLQLLSEAGEVLSIEAVEYQTRNN
jgi:hypothetical protein